MATKNHLKPIAEYSENEVLALLDNPAEYRALPDPELDEFVLAAIGLYAITCRESLIPKLADLYKLYIQRIPQSRRFENYSAIRDDVIVGKLSLNGLLPYLFNDNSYGLVSTVALDYAVLHPIQNGDPLTGPKSVLGYILSEALTNNPAAFGGLVLLGDQRVMELLRDLRHQLPLQAIQIVSRCFAGLMYEAILDFYVSWLEELPADYDETVFRFIAGGLCNVICTSFEPTVWSIERVFPSTLDDCIRTLERVPLCEYAKRLQPRLEAIERREKEPKVMPIVRQVLELESKKPSDEAWVTLDLSLAFQRWFD